MLYAKENGSFDELESVMTDLGISPGNIAVAAEYTDTARDRDDSLLKKVVRQDIVLTNRDWQKSDKLIKAIRKNVVRMRDEEKFRRLLCFAYTLMGNLSCYFLEAKEGNFTSRMEFMESALEPILGEDAKYAAFAACFTLMPGIYLDLGTRNIQSIGSRDIPDIDGETYAKASYFCRDFDVRIPAVLCDRALARLEEPVKKPGILGIFPGRKENSTAAELACSRLKVLIKQVPKGGTPEYRILLAACAEGAYFDKELERFFKANIPGQAGGVLNIAFSLSSPYYRTADLIENCPAAVDADYIRNFAMLNDNAVGGTKQERLGRLYQINKAAYKSVMLTNVAPFIAVEMEKAAMAADKDYDPAGTDIKGAKQRDISKLIAGCFPDCADMVRKYTMGLVTLEEVLPELKKAAPMPKWGDKADRYYDAFGADDFMARCFTVMMTAAEKISYLRYIDNYTGFVFVGHEEEGISMLLREGLDLGTVVSSVSHYIDDSYNKESMLPKVQTALRHHAPELSDLDISSQSVTGRCLILSILSAYADKYKDRLLAAADDSSKAVRDVLTGVLAERPDWHEDICSMLNTRKAAKRELALNVIEKQGAEGYAEELRAAMEAEKSEKIKTRIALLLGLSTGSAEEARKTLTLEETVKELTKGSKVRKLDQFFTMPYKPVRSKSGEELGEDNLKALLMSFAGMDRCGVSETGKAIAGQMDEKDLSVFVQEVFGRWLDLGAQAKTKWVLYFAAVCGGESIVSVMVRYIKEWGENSRGAIAAEAVKALALNGSPMAFMNVDNMSRKFKNKQVRAAAGEALRNAAEELGITTEELADKIVPDLGFGEDMCRVFDYGPRQFRVFITPSLELEIYNGDKKVKSMPKPGASDDKDKAGAAYEAFKEMKKQMKTVITTQKARLEYVLMCDRKWSFGSWEGLFVRNPIMHSFAIGLIWGIYKDGRLESTFRYMEDGTFNSMDEEETEISPDAVIGLVHPIELTEEERKTWTEQLSDYEIVQPFMQLSRKIYEPEKDEKNGINVLRFVGKEINSLSLIGKMTKLGWYKGEAEDGGAFYTFYRNDVARRIKNSDGTYSSEGFGAELVFSGASIQAYDFEGEDVTIDRLFFFRPDSRPWYYSTEPEKYLPVNELNSRYFSEVIMQLTSVFGEEES